MKLRTYCLACRKHTNNIGSKTNSSNDKQRNQRQIKMC